MFTTKEKQLQQLRLKIQLGQPVNSKKYCELMLEKVSRTFAMTIRALGFTVRRPVLLGYLFCRIADTLEDNKTFSPQLKSSLLQNYYDLFQSDGKDTQLMNKIKDTCRSLDANKDDEFLTQHLDIVFLAYENLGQRTRQIIRDTVFEMVRGMKTTVQKQEGTRSLGTASVNELDRYCYYVAGTVGHMLTNLFHEYSPWIGKKRFQKLSIDKEAFGAGLQLTNIIKDAVGDLQRGVSYLPRDLADKYNVPLEKFHHPQYRTQAKKILNDLIIKAAKNLNYALRYSILIPKTEPRMRLFCLWPLFFAIRTLKKAVNNKDLFSLQQPIKISRKEVKQTIRYTALMCLWDFMIVREYKKLLSHLEKALDTTIPMELKSLRFLPITPT